MLLGLRKIKKGSITFVSNKLKRLSQKELKDEKLYIEETAITSNNNMKLFVNNNCFIKSIDNFFTPDRFKNKLDLSKVRYVDIERSCFYPEQNFNNLNVVSDLFILHTSNISLAKTDEGNVKTSSLEIINKGKGLSRIDIKNTDISFFNGGTLEVDAKKLELGKGGGKSETMRFWGKNQLKAKEKIAIKDSAFIDTTINSENLELNIVSSDFKKSSINFIKASEENSVSGIEYLTISNSALDNISGNLRGSISWVKANNITIGEDARFSHNVIQNHLPEPTYLLNLNHITLAPYAFISFNFGENFIKSLNNCYLEGELNIQGDCSYEINLSTIKNDNSEESTVFISSNSGSPLIEGVIFNGDVEIKNIDKLSYSEISNSTLSSGTSIALSDLFLFDQVIDECSGLVQEKKDEVVSVVTNKLDIL